MVGGGGLKATHKHTWAGEGRAEAVYDRACVCGNGSGLAWGCNINVRSLPKVK